MSGPHRSDDEIDELIGAGRAGSAARFEASIRQRSEAYKANGYHHDAGKNPVIDARLEAPLFNVGDLHNRPVPPRRWLVRDQIPMRNATMFAGDGGLGKTLVAMQLATAVATGKPWLNMEVDEPGPVVCLLCEDELDELHRRQGDINRHYGISFAHLEGLVHWIPRVGESNLLQDNGGQKYAAPELTPLYHAIDVHVRMTKAKLLILDSLYNIYGGSEIDRSSVEQFVVSLRQLAMRNDCAVLFTSHPSIEGMNSGRGYSGSTGWNAIVRSRLYLTASDDPTDEDARMLKTMKLNYGKKVEHRLEWSEGVFVRQERDTGAVAQIERNVRDRTILDLVAEHARKGRHLSKEPRSGERYLPSVAARQIPGMKREVAKKIMTNLLMDRVLDYCALDSHSKMMGLVVAETRKDSCGDVPWES